MLEHMTVTERSREWSADIDGLGQHVAGLRSQAEENITESMQASTTAAASDVFDPAFKTCDLPPSAELCHIFVRRSPAIRNELSLSESAMC